MVRTLTSLLGAALTLGLWSVPATATTWQLAAILDGAQEVPAVVTPATGSATITYDDVTNLLQWTISFQDLVGTINNSHFHGPALPGVPAGVRVGIPFTAGVTADTLVGSATITDPFEAELLAGLWYVNVHSTFRPGGEIRGQVTVVPEPGTLALLGLGLLALGRARANRTALDS